VAYTLWLRPEVHAARKRLPGKIRRRVVRVIDGLRDDPRPPRSRALKLPESLDPAIVDVWEVRRLRLGRWRLVYAVSEEWLEVAVLTVEQRPPYDYDDLGDLMAEL
jgi:mRNA-degrading endonuclease RelE of RelBE toxin-antitoxin system